MEIAFSKRMSTSSVMPGSPDFLPFFIPSRSEEVAAPQSEPALRQEKKPIPKNDTGPDLREKLQNEQVRFAEAFRTGYVLTLRFVISRGASAELAEEIAQAAWVKGWECRSQLQRPEMIGAWINSIAKNMFRNQVRTDQRFQGLTDNVDSTTTPHAAIDVTTMLNGCPEKDSHILTGYYLEGYSTEEIAHQEGMCPSTVRVRLLRIRRALRGRFAKPPATKNRQSEPAAATFHLQAA